MNKGANRSKKLCKAERVVECRLPFYIALCDYIAGDIT